MTLQVESPCVYTSQGVPISVTGIAQVKIQGQNEDMLLTACEQFLGKSETEIQHIALVTLEGHQRAIMGSMTVEEIYKDRKKFSKQVFEVASSDLVNMGITVVSYTLKDIRDEEVILLGSCESHKLRHLKHRTNWIKMKKRKRLTAFCVHKLSICGLYVHNQKFDVQCILVNFHVFNFPNY